MECQCVSAGLAVQRKLNPNCLLGWVVQSWGWDRWKFLLQNPEGWGSRCSTEPETGSERTLHQSKGERETTPWNPGNRVQHRTEVKGGSASPAATRFSPESSRQSRRGMQDRWSQKGRTKNKNAFDRSIEDTFKTKKTWTSIADSFSVVLTVFSPQCTQY